MTKYRELPELEHHEWEYVPQGADGVAWKIVHKNEDGEVTKIEGDPNGVDIREYRESPIEPELLPLKNGSEVLVYALRTLTASEISRIRRYAATAGLLEKSQEMTEEGVDVHWSTQVNEALAVAICRIAIQAIRILPGGDEFKLFRNPFMGFPGALALQTFDQLGKLGVEQHELADIARVVWARSDMTEAEEGQ